jgi:hypothetical protein
LKDRGAFGEERSFIVRDGTNWTEAQRRDVRNYEPGMVVEFHQNISGKRKRANGKRIGWWIHARRERRRRGT